MAETSVEPYLFLAAANAALDRTEEARQAAGQVRALKPDFKLSAWRETQPYRDPEYVSRLIGRLRMAGRTDAGTVSHRSAP